jgi:hypothetical protein
MNLETLQSRHYDARQLFNLMLLKIAIELEHIEIKDSVVMILLVFLFMNSIHVVNPRTTYAGKAR